MLLSLEFLLVALIPRVSGAGVITCYGFGGVFGYDNNTRCPGSNACCGVDSTCLSNRLCHSPKDGPNRFIRGPCAVDPYDSGTCAQICLYNETDGFLPRVTTCADGSLCCDNDAHCCDAGTGTFLDNNGLIADRAPTTTYSYGPERTAATFRTDTETSSRPSIPLGVPTTSATVEPSTSPNPLNSGSESEGATDTGVKIGLGVAIPVGCIAIGLAGFWFWRRRRCAKVTGGTDATDQTRVGQQSPKPWEAGQSYAGVYDWMPTRPTMGVDVGAGVEPRRPVELSG